jgi:endonuclease/exonuclease/phosphatase family metal-dependent hydrolase
MKRFFRFGLRLVQGGSAILLLASLAAAYVHPNYLPFSSILTLGFVPIFIGNLLVWMGAYGVKKRLKYWNLMAMLLALPFLFRSIGVNKAQESKGENVFIFNSKLLNGYSKESLTKTTELLKTENVSVAALLEWHSRKGKISTALYKHQRFMPFINSTGVTQFGSLFLSKYPIRDIQRIEFPFKTANLAYYADVEIRSKTYRFFVIHLQSNKFSEDQLQYVRNPSIDEDGQANAWALAKAYMKTGKMRATQADIIQLKVKESPHPVVLLGDFNDTPQGYCYQTLSKNLKDSFLEAGWGWEGTYIPFKTFLRIDFILCSNEIDVWEYKSSNQIPSDHKSVMANLGL